MTTFVTGPVAIEDMLVVTATYDPSNRWNGWIASPLVTREEVEKIAEWLKDDDTCTMTFEGNTLIYTSYAGTPEEYVDRVEPNDAGLYDVGLGWVWYEVVPDGRAADAVGPLRESE